MWDCPCTDPLSRLRCIDFPVSAFAKDLSALPADGGGALHGFQSQIALLSGPQFHDNTVTEAAVPSPGRHRRLLAPNPAQLGMASQLDSAGGALHFAKGTMAVCEQCEFKSNEAALGADVFLGPEVEHRDIYISSTAFGSSVDVYPSSAASELAQGCWPLACAVEDSMQSTTCGERAVHTTQLTRGTSSLGFAESVTITTQQPYFLAPRSDQCVHTCLDAAPILFPPSKCTALVPTPPAPFPLPVARTGEFPINTPAPDSKAPAPPEQPPAPGMLCRQPTHCMRCNAHLRSDCHV